ncbi:coproporphyrinogen III oxidase [Phellopilus nigrolimitatus]|nr:coproporphyrinogen III oxidase [Phellopilus nigrolimitatus]
MSVSADPKPMRDRMSEYILSLQDSIVSALEALDPDAPKFKRDAWVRPQGGQGTSCVFAAPSALSQSALEKAGVNISIVYGMLPPAAIRQMVADHASIPFDPADPRSLPFFAAGISLVIHPRNPSAPTVHANYRYFELENPDALASEEGSAAAPPLAWWFGGGADLTPSYFFEEDARHFHGTLKAACAPHGAALHPAFKAWCDEYFLIVHRGERRGVGGIFFDDLSPAPHTRLPDDARACGDAFCAVVHTPFDEHMRRWQLLRRGRYVEFNLVYDRGTKFGLMTPGARVESILMSLPETARWEYMSDMGTEENTEEHKLLEILKNPRDWA